MLSSAVWRSPSRRPMLASGLGCSGVRTPSWSVIVPSPFWSRPRPKPEKRTVWGGTTVSTDASLRAP